MEQKEETIELVGRGLCERLGGLLIFKTGLSLSLWYVFSGMTLFSNKVVLTDTDIPPAVFGAYQILCTAILGGIRIKGLKAFKKLGRRSVSDDKDGSPGSWITFTTTMAILGTTRLEDPLRIHTNCMSLLCAGFSVWCCPC